MKPKELRRELQRKRYQPTKAAYRLIKKHPKTWLSHGGIRTFRRGDGVTIVLTAREAALLRRRELNRRMLDGHEHRKAETRRGRIAALVFTLCFGLPAAALVLTTTFAVYWTLWGTP